MAASDSGLQGSRSSREFGISREADDDDDLEEDMQPVSDVEGGQLSLPPSFKSMDYPYPFGRSVRSDPDMVSDWDLGLPN
jgi:hypothetical protein